MTVLLGKDCEDRSQRRRADTLRNELHQRESSQREATARTSTISTRSCFEYLSQLTPTQNVFFGRSRSSTFESNDLALPFSTEAMRDLMSERRTAVKERQRKNHAEERSGLTDAEGVGAKIQRSGLVRRLEHAVDRGEEDVPKDEGELRGEVSGEGGRERRRRTMVVRMLFSEWNLLVNSISSPPRSPRRLNSPLPTLGSIPLQRQLLDANLPVVLPLPNALLAHHRIVQPLRLLDTRLGFRKRALESVSLRLGDLERRLDARNSSLEGRLVDCSSSSASPSSRNPRTH